MGSSYLLDFTYYKKPHKDYEYFSKDSETLTHSVYYHMILLAIWLLFIFDEMYNILLNIFIK